MMDPVPLVGQALDAEPLRLLADDLAALRDTQAPRLITASLQARRWWDSWSVSRRYTVESEQ